MWAWRRELYPPSATLLLLLFNQLDVILALRHFNFNVPSTATSYLTDEDFKHADNLDENTTFLTAEDFDNAEKYASLLGAQRRGSSSVLYQQRFWRGDIRGKAALRRETLHPRKPAGSNHDGSQAIRRNGVSVGVKKWPGARIPYVLSQQYTPRERAILARAFQEYHKRTCVRFEPRQPFDRDFLFIGKIDGCYSDVGRAGGRQELSLDDGCLHLDTVIHELMHSVGFYHEHERWDRDAYIAILWGNIDKEAYDQFGRVDLTESSYYNQPYDYLSIMHYDSMAFSRNGRETLVARNPQMTPVLGSAVDFSVVDLTKIHRMYQCHEMSAPMLPPPLPMIQQPPPPPPLTHNELNEQINANSVMRMPPGIVPGGENSVLVPLPRTIHQPQSQAVHAVPIQPMQNLPPPSPSIAQVPPLPPSLLAQPHIVLPINPVSGMSPQDQITPPIAPVQTSVVDPNCADRSENCRHWLDRCGSAYFSRVMRDFCPRSCGFCAVPVGLEAVTPPSMDTSDMRFRQLTLALDNGQSMRSFPVWVDPTSAGSVNGQSGVLTPPHQPLWRWLIRRRRGTPNRVIRKQTAGSLHLTRKKN